MALPSKKVVNKQKKIEKLFPPGIEPGTISVLGRCDNHYTAETRYMIVFMF